MRKLFSILGKVAKALTIIAVGSAIRISRGTGKGVFEQAMQTAISEVAQRYVRSVNPQ